MSIDYKINAPVSADEFVQLLESCSLGARRPVHDRECMEGMLANSNLIVSAWEESRLIGIARSMTDFHYACYLSDLAVAESHQHQGIGKQLQFITQQQLGPHANLILIAAPAANDYYQKIGFTHNKRCWVLARNAELT